MLSRIVFVTFAGIVLASFLNCTLFSTPKGSSAPTSESIIPPPQLCSEPSRIVTCPANGATFAPNNSGFLSLVGNELQIAMAYGADLDAIGEYYRKAGVKNVRIVLNWREIESSPGVFNWGYVDRLVQVFVATGINPVGILSNTPRWAAPNCPQDTGQCTPDDLNFLKRFARRAVLRYGATGTNSIHDWEIRVEALPNHHLLTKEQYVAELNAAYSAIKAKDASARVWGPEVAFLSASPDETGNEVQYEWIDHTIANGQFDVFSVHHLAATTPAAAFAHTQRIRLRLDAAGLSAVPIAITAMALTNPVGTPEGQAQNLQDMYACTAAGGASFAFWFAGTEWAPRLEDIQNDVTYGVLDYDFALPSKVKPKEAYNRLSELGCLSQ